MLNYTYGRIVDTLRYVAELSVSICKKNFWWDHSRNELKQKFYRFLLCSWMKLIALATASRADKRRWMNALLYFSLSVLRPPVFTGREHRLSEPTITVNDNWLLISHVASSVYRPTLQCINFNIPDNCTCGFFVGAFNELSICTNRTNTVIFTQRPLKRRHLLSHSCMVE